MKFVEKIMTFLYFQVTLYKVQASRLAALNDRLIGIKVGDFWLGFILSSVCFFPVC